MKRTIHGMLATVFLLAVPGGRAAEYYVDAAGDDNASGLATNTAWRSIQTAVNRLQAGDTLWIRGGVYRGKVSYTNTRGRKDAPIRVLAFPGEEVVLKGSVVASGWVEAGAGAWRLPAWNHNSQQVFVDGVRLTQLGWPNEYVRDRACGCSSWLYMPVGHDCRAIGAAGRGFDVPNPTAAMPEGSFWYDAATGDLFVRLPGDAAPADHLMEVSIENGVFYDISGVGCLHVENITFMHTSTFTYTQFGFPVVRIGPDSLIRDCAILDGDGSGLWLSSRSRAERCRIADHGLNGITMNNSVDFLVDGCEVSGVNYRHMNLEYAGAMKFIPDCAGIVQNCVVRDNLANGIWFDTCNSGKPIIVRNNVVTNNSPPVGRNYDASASCAIGIFIEISSTAQVYGNLVSGNACIGIASSGARHVRIFNNTIQNTRAVGSGGPRAHYALLVDRPLPAFPVEHVRAHNNLLIDNPSDYDMVVARQDGYLVRGLELDHNLIWRTTPGGSIAPNARAVFAYLGGNYSSLADWTAATGFDAHSLSAPPQVDASLRPLAGSPLIDAGTASTVPTWLDPQGLRGIDGNGDGIPAPDIGALEFTPASVRVLHVDAGSAAPLAPYTQPVSAASNVADALSVAQAGDVILIRPGVYPVAEELVVDRAVILRGAIDGVNSVVLTASTSNRVARLDADGAILENLVLRNGRAATGGCVRLDRGSMRDCRVENGQAGRGGGVWAASGTVVRATTITGCSATEAGGGLWLDAGATAESCTLSGNTASASGGGLHAGAGSLLLDCTLSQNQATDGGGARLAGGRAERCFFDRNTAAGTGGGAHVSHAGAVEACRVVDNQAGSEGGGLLLADGATAVNSLLLRNQAEEGGGVALNGAELRYSTLSANTATLRGGGLLARAGAQVSATIVYFNSAPSGAQVARDGESGEFDHTACPDPLPGTGNISADPLFVSRTGGDYRLAFGSPCIDAAPAAGFPAADIDLFERPRNGDADASARADIGAFENLMVHYVSLSSPAPARPYGDWSTAARNIQDALSVCKPGSVVLVAPGTYPLTSAVNLSSSVQVLSTGGPEVTHLDGQNLTRCVMISHGSAVLDGFTLCRGRASAGAGAYIRFSGTLRRCIVRDNVSTGDLGGAFAYLTANFPNPCTAYADSLLKEGGGGVVLSSGGLLENCLVYGNTAARAAGVLLTRGGEARHCTIADNSATVDAGGAALIDGGRLVNSIVWSNIGGTSSNLFLGGTLPDVRHTCSDPVPAGGGNFSAVPGWSGAADLYRLSAGSPVLDRGEASTTATDASGATRPQDGDGDGVARPDPGAWELVRTPGDADGDGLGDAAEGAAGTNPHLADTDGDLVPDAEEIQLGTNPLAATSYIKLAPPFSPPTGAGLTLRWRSVPAHVYSISRGTNLLEGVTGLIATNLPPTAPWNEYTDPGASGPGPFFYRIEGREP